MNLLCWIFGHKWREASRRYTTDLDHVDYKCDRCGEKAGGPAGLFVPPKRPSLKE